MINFYFNTSELKILTAAQAAQLVANLPLTIVKFDIIDAKFGINFMVALIERINKVSKMNELMLKNTKVCDEKEGQEPSVQLTEVISSSNNTKHLYLWKTKLIGLNNLNQWGDSLMKNTTLIILGLKGVGNEIVSELEDHKQYRTLSLYIG